MEVISNGYRRIAWHIRRALNLKEQSIAPVIWRSSSITTDHMPTRSFQEELPEKDRNRLRNIIEETKMISRLSLRFPSRISDADWNTLLECQNRKQRLDHLIFMHKIERIKLEEKRKKQLARKDQQSRCLNEEQALLFRPTRNQKTFEWLNILKAYRLGAPILAVDCQFIRNLSPRGQSLTAQQLQYLYAETRSLEDPFLLHFVNFNHNDDTIMKLMRRKGIGEWNNIIPIVSNKCFTRVFNKNDIVYLSPDGEETLKTVETGKVYIIGGIVDRVIEKGISKTASKDAAMQAGVKCCRLPIDDYIEFKSGSKFLTLVAVMNILNDVYVYGDWKRAFEKNIPVRNIKAPEEKNKEIADRYKRIRVFNTEILRIVEKKLGPDEFREIK